MHSALIKYIRERSESALTEKDITLLKEAFLPKKLRKRQFLLQAGEVCKYIGFIVKGATRQYTVDEKGTEHILNLGIENWWASDRCSFINQTPSIYNIDAWEETDLLLLPKANGYYERVNSIPAFMEMRIKVEDNHHIATQSRLNALINHQAEYRYEQLLIRHPEFLRRFPQHIIASYIGITKETLSRIRNQTTKMNRSYQIEC